MTARDPPRPMGLPALRDQTTCRGICDAEPDFGRLIDMTRLKELLEEIDTGDLTEIVNLFLEETDAILLRVSGAQPGPELAGDLHFLKGSALNLGLAALAGLCHDAERCHSSGHRSPLDPGIFRVIYDASKLAFRAALEREDDT